MKVPGSIRALHEAQIDGYRRLGEEVKRRLDSIWDKSWHYEGRVKTLESYALKLESGRCAEPGRMEDFFACTIVVPNSSSIIGAERLVRGLFDLQERRPRDPSFTKIRPESFPFDDLRLYLTWRDDPKLPPSGLCRMTFEVQIKTFLLHAWAIATHDLVYKTDAVHWGKERVAFQIRAMLEHAEASIKEIEALSRTDSLSRSTATINECQDMIAFLKETWQAGALPGNIKLLADNAADLCWALGISLTDLRHVIREESAVGKGINTLDLSPFGIIVQSLINRMPERMQSLLRDEKYRRKILLPPEVNLPEGFVLGLLRNALVIG